MSELLVKAFVLCDEIAPSPNDMEQKDLCGAGLSNLLAEGSFPIKRTFWIYLELSDQKSTGQIQIAVMRADSGRRFFFRVMPVTYRDPLHTTIVTIRVFECLLPAPGVYFVELWYDGEWQLDQRLEADS